MHLKVRILRVLLYIAPYRRADNVDLEVVLSCPPESLLCQSRCVTQMPQPFKNLRVDQLQDVSRQPVFQISNVRTLVDFETAGRYFLQFQRFPMKDIPHSDGTFSSLDCPWTSQAAGPP